MAQTDVVRLPGES